MVSLYNPWPDNTRDTILYVKIKRKLLTSLEYLLTKIPSSSILPNLNYLQQLSNSRDNEKVSAYLHAFNAYLVAAVTQHNSVVNYDFLTQYKLINDYNYYYWQDNNVLNSLIEPIILYDLPADSFISAVSPFAGDSAKKLIQQALQIIKEIAFPYYQHIATLVGEFLLFKSNKIKAGSSFHLFGLIYINIDAMTTVLDMIDTIVHESAHLYLYSLMADDALLLNAPSEYFYSPIKGKPRPIMGIFHAAFVLWRVMEVLLKLQSANLLSPEETNAIAARLKSYAAIATESFAIVFAHGKMTAIGQQLITATYKEFCKIKIS